MMIMMIMMIMTTMTIYGNDCDDDEDTDNSCKIHKKLGEKNPIQICLKTLFVL